MNDYIFTSERLGFRNWKVSDVAHLHTINSDATVMQFFPSKPTQEQTEDFIKRMQIQFVKNKFCYFAVELLKTKEYQV